MGMGACSTIARQVPDKSEVRCTGEEIIFMAMDAGRMITPVNCRGPRPDWSGYCGTAGMLAVLFINFRCRMGWPAVPRRRGSRDSGHGVYCRWPTRNMGCYPITITRSQAPRASPCSKATPQTSARQSMRSRQNSKTFPCSDACDRCSGMGRREPRTHAFTHYFLGGILCRAARSAAAFSSFVCNSVFKVLADSNSALSSATSA